MKSSIGRLVPFALASSLLFCSLARAQQGGFPMTPESASSFAGPSDQLFNALLVISLFITIGIALTILFFAFKYRRGRQADRANAPSKNLALEFSWIGVMTVLGLGMFVWGARLYIAMYRIPPNALPVTVVGKQWMWKIQHPDGRREMDELHVPVGRPVVLQMTSEDVIHSFSVPAFRVKQDVLPGRYTSLWFEATRPGRYHLFCSQYCGTEHSKMGGWVYALPPADYAAWLRQGNPQPSLAGQGEKLFAQLGCTGCHGDSNTVRAPNLAGIYDKPVPLQNGSIVTANDAYLHDSIVLPQQQIAAGYPSAMPSYKGRVTEEQLLALVAYLRSLSDENTLPDAVKRAPSRGNVAPQ